MSLGCNQSNLSYDEVAKIVGATKLDGFPFQVEVSCDNHSPEAFRLVVVLSVPDVRDPKNIVKVGTERRVPMVEAIDETAIMRIVRLGIIEAITHEVDEFLRFGELRPFDPHISPHEWTLPHDRHSAF